MPLRAAAHFSLRALLMLFRAAATPFAADAYDAAADADNRAVIAATMLCLRDIIMRAARRVAYACCFEMRALRLSRHYVIASHDLSCLMPGYALMLLRARYACCAYCLRY